MKFFKKSADQKIIEDLTRQLAAEKSSPMIHVVTENYDKMKQFFIDLGLNVDESEEGLQFTPFYNQGRGTAVYLEDMTICLEESTHTDPSGAIYFDVGEIEETRLKNIAKKYKVKEELSIYGIKPDYYITPPDGGVITAGKREQGDGGERDK